ncbi:MAG: Two-component response regulator [Myxococcales bacterium]|nr:Two-component response regulator [Myxococcales bacterium]
MTRSVLVVDDDADIREVMQLMLERHGYEVKVAADGVEALERLHEGEPPSVILLDLMMPGMNGLEFRAAQLRDPSISEVPVVALTGANNVATHAKASGLEVMRKPVPIGELLAAMDRHVVH